MVVLRVGEEGNYSLRTVVVSGLTRLRLFRAALAHCEPLEQLFASVMNAGRCDMSTVLGIDIGSGRAIAIIR